MSVFKRFTALCAVFLSVFCVAVPTASAAEISANRTFSIDQNHWLWHEWKAHGQPKATWPKYWRDSCRLTRVPCTKDFWEHLPSGFVVTVPSHVSQETAGESVRKDVLIVNEPRVSTLSDTNVMSVTQRAAFVTEVTTLMSTQHADSMNQFVAAQNEANRLQTLQLAFLIVVCTIILLFARNGRKWTQRSDEDDDAFLFERDNTFFGEPKQCVDDAVKTSEESEPQRSCGAHVATRTVRIFLEKGSLGSGLELGGDEKKCHEFLKPLDERPILQPGIYYADVTSDNRIITVLSVGQCVYTQP